MRARAVVCWMILPCIACTGVHAAPPGSSPAESAVTAADLPRLWEGLGRSDDENLKAVHRDMRRLAQVPALVVPFLKEKLKPVAAPDAKLIDRLIADFENNENEKRVAASKSLAAIGPLAAPLLEKKLSQPDLGAETRTRLEELIDQFDRENDQLTIGALRGLRGVEVLLWTGAPEARELLEALSQGADGARLTMDARRALAAWSAPRK